MKSQNTQQKEENKKLQEELNTTSKGKMDENLYTVFYRNRPAPPPKKKNLDHKYLKSVDQIYLSTLLNDLLNARGVSRIFERGGVSWFPKKRSSDFKGGGPMV